MDSIRILVEQYARAAWRRRWVGVFITWLICGVGWVGVYLVPNQYEFERAPVCRRRCHPDAAAAWSGGGFGSDQPA